MIKNVLLSLRQGPARKGTAADKKASAAALPGFGPWGLPPHVRGKEDGLTQRRQHLRITPAHAGKSFFRRPVQGNIRDHPRVCGEKGKCRSPPHTTIGSPPRMRGKARPGSAYNAASGITPACAGKRPPWAASCHGCRDHPRVCGEKFPSKLLSVVILGSPPRVRGKDYAKRDSNERHGITPACAGKRNQLLGGAGGSGDHPRVCGEKWLNWLCLCPSAGSPPRVRGKVFMMPTGFSTARITPAHAGKRKHFLHGCKRGWDHPRACGEKLACGSTPARRIGSPPRMRGKVQKTEKVLGAQRITPAHAGKRSRKMPPAPPHWDHPRACGEKRQRSFNAA